MVVKAAAIPLSAEVKQAAEFLNKNPIDYALYGGEDFQLLFTMNPEQFQQLQAADTGAIFALIGEVLPPGKGVVMIDEQADMHLLQPKGYNHFTSD